MTNIRFRIERNGEGGTGFIEKDVLIIRWDFGDSSDFFEIGDKITIMEVY